jgi:hypothetical protein
MKAKKPSSRKESKKTELVDSPILKRMASNLSASQQAEIKRITERVDRKFVEEKTTLIRDTYLAMQSEGRGATKRLLQRNLWATGDALALYLDQVGLTQTIRDIAPTALSTIEFDDPEVVAFEAEVARSFLGVSRQRADKMGLGNSGFVKVFEEIERERAGKRMTEYTSKGPLSLHAAWSQACVRPGRAKPPQLGVLALTLKEAAIIILGASNLVGLWFPILGWVWFALSLTGSLVIAVSGC